ncbi:DUF1326 domain-containing protein [Marinibaculum pumilum]|uniref:DUF1326 domain-containing protein n=1 Tax=Marinibaculum pumilum TaxID=1766165 RepID=A0ABV7L9E0_9PROT
MTWRISGEYMETCNCDYVCPCIYTHMTAPPTEGDCKVAIAMQIDAGSKDGTDLGGVRFIVMMMSPGPMADGDMVVGLIVDEGASDAQVQAVTEIASGQAGGPMAAMAPLVATFAGVERRPVRFEIDGMSRHVTAGDMVDQTCIAVMGGARPGEPIYLENTAHPANHKLALARNGHSRFDAFGITWDDASGTRNGHFAPFAWKG